MKKITIIPIILVIIVGGLYLILGDNKIDGNKIESAEGKSSEVAKPNIDQANLAEISEYQYTEEYTNPTYNFSFKYPTGFTVSSLPNDGNEVLIIQNTEKGIGVQIVISSFGGSSDIDITAEYIMKEIPDLKVSESQEVLIGTNRKGLAFLSDNQSFGGASREVWFVWNGKLYQISTYAEMDSLIKGLFGTWKFIKK